jgi:hypothetical protein
MTPQFKKLYEVGQSLLPRVRNNTYNPYNICKQLAHIVDMIHQNGIIMIRWMLVAYFYDDVSRSRRGIGDTVIKLYMQSFPQTARSFCYPVSKDSRHSPRSICNGTEVGVNTFTGNAFYAYDLQPSKG